MFEFILLVVMANLIILVVLYFIRHVIAIRAPVLFMAVGISILFCIMYPFLVAWLSYPRVIYIYGAFILAGAGVLYIIEMKFFTAEKADANKSTGIAAGDVLAALEGGPSIDVGRGIFQGFGTAGKDDPPNIPSLEMHLDVDIDQGNGEKSDLLNIDTAWTGENQTHYIHESAAGGNPFEELAAGIMPGREPDETEDSLIITGHEDRVPTEEERPVSLLYEEVSGGQETAEEAVPLLADFHCGDSEADEVPACALEDVSEDVSVEGTSEEYVTVADGCEWAETSARVNLVEPAAGGTGGEKIIEEYGLLQGPAENDVKTVTYGLEPEDLSEAADFADVVPGDEGKTDLLKNDEAALEAVQSHPEGVSGEISQGMEIMLELPDKMTGGEDIIVAPAPAYIQDPFAWEQEMTPDIFEAAYVAVPIPEEEDITVYHSGQEAAAEYQEALSCGVNTEISQIAEMEFVENTETDISCDLKAEEGPAGDYFAVEQVVEEPVVEVTAVSEAVFYSEPLFSVEAEEGSPTAGSLSGELGDIPGQPVELEIKTIVARAFDALGAGDKFGAAKSFFKALKLDPPPKLAAMVCVEISSIYLSEGRKPQALAVMEMLQEVWGPMLDENDSGRIKTIIIELRREV